MLSSLFPLGWAHYLAGGLVIGAGVARLYVATGRLAGMSSVFSSSWSFVSARAAFQQPRWRESRAWRLALGGLVAGFGARLAGGCTSGHGICGIGSLKLPSLLAVLTFMATGFITAQGLAMLGAAP